MNKINTGGSAFPLHSEIRPPLDKDWCGMTLRDYFAAKAMQVKDFTVRPYDTTSEIAKDCYRMADAMLKARNHEPL